MARGKVKIAFMQNRASRKLTMNKRKQGLFKKMDELTTMCDIDGCVVVYTPNCPEPDVWPSHTAASSVIQRYYNKPEFERKRNHEDQEIVAKKELVKAQEEFAKLVEENKLIELNIAVHQYFGNNRAYFQYLPLEYLTYLSNHVLEPKLEEMEARAVISNPNV